MKKRIWLAVMAMLISVSAFSSHIVGGEMALVHVPGTDYTYRIQLILYYDARGNVAGDIAIRAAIFSKRTNAQLRQVILNPLGIIQNNQAIGTVVEYFQPECSDGVLVTYRVEYLSDPFELSPTIYNDVQGYYIAYERCCRNYNITNIFSNNPDISPYDEIAGQTFYVEFPPVIKDGVPFINSSPRLFAPLADYACPNRNYFVDFTGTDEDGDSLVYSMVTPLNSIERFLALPANGVPNKGPYPDIRWRSPFALNNILKGNPDLRISTDGLLTVKPSELSIGLHVFAVKCEEFRNGVKIGEVRRDFQLLVQNSCPEAEPPSIVGKGPDDATFGTTNQLEVFYDATVTDANRCFEVKITDPDAGKFDDMYKEDVRIMAIPIGFKKDVSGVLPDDIDATIINGTGSAVFQICLPQCSYRSSDTYQLGIVAFDDACTIPLSDTLYVTVHIESIVNQFPQFNNTAGPRDITDELEEGDPMKSWTLQASDGDGEVVRYRLVPVDFNLADVGMTFSQPYNGQGNGSVSAQLTWDPKCDVYDFTDKTEFDLYFIVDDDDRCLLNQPDTARIQLRIIDLPESTPPLIDNAFTPGVDTLEITRKIYEPLAINVTGTDADNSTLWLRGYGVDFPLSSYGISFPKTTGAGNVSSQFMWGMDCSLIDITDKDLFEFDLMVVDSLSKCKFYLADTLHVIVHVEPPDNQAPELTITSLNDAHVIDNGEMRVTRGQEIRLSLTSTDADTQPADNLVVELTGGEGTIPPEGYVFTSQGSTASLVWNPDCSIYEGKDYSNDYYFSFRVRDQRCFNPEKDSLELKIVLEDVKNDYEFLPMNFVSPNGDGCNDYFSMTSFDDTQRCQPVDQRSFELPADNCAGEFSAVRIYNRWGKQVFFSNQRDFRWVPDDLPVGVYYFFLEFTNRQYRGSVTVWY
jgi:hypothetical protein